MIFRWLADGVALIHTGFVLFVVVGGLFAVRWPRLAWAHVPAAIWGVLIEYAGWTCPLTPLENALRDRAGEAGYAGGFVEHYVLRALYPSGWTTAMGRVLGSIVLVINVVVYTYLVKRWRVRRTTPRRTGRA
jgi:hypothetical protein